MPGNKRPNKARNQVHGSVNAPWFAKARKKERGRRKQAKASRKANRGN